jgi:hypothetical protein
MTIDEIKKALLDRDLEEFVDELLFEKAPFVFESLWDRYRPWRYQLGAAIKVRTGGIQDVPTGPSVPWGATLVDSCGSPGEGVGWLSKPLSLSIRYPDTYCE